MTVFNSKVNRNSDGFKKNRQEMLALIDQLGELNARGAALSEKRKTTIRIPWPTHPPGTPGTPA